MLPRLHLFEINDSLWAPRALRDSIIESLSRTLQWGDVLSGLVAPFQEFLSASGADEVLDMCSGAGGPARILVREIRRAGAVPPRFILTDLQPQPEVWSEARAAHPWDIVFEPGAVDATDVPEPLARGRARVIINAFHHFPPPLAASILADAVRGSTGVFIAEPFDRNPLRFASMMPVGSLAMAVNPILSPRDRLQKLLFTLTPVMAAASLWDGIVSALRIYSRDDLEAMVRPFGNDFVWTWGRFRYAFGGNGYYFYGVPRSRRTASESR